MRGARRGINIPHVPQGIIPADAGSTRATVSPSPYGWDHPRGCGEHIPVMHIVHDLLGSSPRMRGAPVGERVCCLRPDGARLRIIPADAGSTLSQKLQAQPIKDHPRGCGEHTMDMASDGDLGGSSPRMRGAQQDQPGQKPRPGIIPADAGSTRFPRLSSRFSWDHPRGCGEHSEPVNRFVSLRGSSPRMRGALGVIMVPSQYARIIPADAGSTVVGIAHLFSAEDHPRGCGEH